MTFEHKLLVGLEEIKAIVFECLANGCESKVVIAPDRTDTLPMTCPHGHAWDWNIPTTSQASYGSPVLLWLQSLRRLRDPISKKFGFRLLLEFEGPEK